MVDEVGTIVLGERRHTRTETSALAGVPLDDAVTLWRAMGFAVVADDVPVFTDRDVAALRTAWSLRERGVVDEAGLVALTRTMAQSMSRLAVSHAATAAAYLARFEGDDAVHAAADELVPSVGALLEFVWRRHLVAATESVLAGAAGDAVGEVPVAVGFADLVGFTELSRTLAPEELAATVETFEAVSARVVGDHAGRVVKTLGDEVLFTVAEASVAADTALALVAAVHAALERDLRVGVAYGPVLAHLGDVFGPTVNIASRLTSLAHPGTVLLDRGAASALRDDPRYDVAPLRRHAVRGYAHLAPFRLRRSVTS